VELVLNRRMNILLLLCLGLIITSCNFFGKDDGGGSSSSTETIQTVDGSEYAGKSFILQFGRNTMSDHTASYEKDEFSDVAIDDDGYIYAVGYTRGNLFETNAFYRESDAIVVKMKPNKSIVWAKQIGGALYGWSAAGDDYATAVAVDSSGNVYVGGHTFGDLAETNADPGDDDDPELVNNYNRSEESGGTSDIFIAKLDSSGNLEEIRQFGRSTSTNSTEEGIFESDGEEYYRARDNERLTGMDIDSAGNIYIAGTTDGFFIETSEEDLSDLEKVNTGNDIYAMKLNSSLDVQWSTQIGEGSFELDLHADNEETVVGLKLKSDGNIIIAGSTESDLGEETGGGKDIYILELVGSTGEVEYFKQLGVETIVDDNDDALDISDEMREEKFEDIIENISDGDDIVLGFTLDSSGNIYLTGSTTSTLSDNLAGSGTNIFVAKINTSSDGDIQWITQFGQETIYNFGFHIGDDSQKGIGISVNESEGSVWINGLVTNPLGEREMDYPVVDPDTDIFLSELKIDTGDIAYIRQLGDISIEETGDKEDHSASRESRTERSDHTAGKMIFNDDALYFVGYSYGNFADENLQADEEDDYAESSGDGSSFSDALIFKLHIDDLRPHAPHIKF